mgnify:CR=1 FL=1
MIRPQLHKNGVTAAVDQIIPTNPKSNDYGPRLAIAICFDLLQDAEKNSINSAVADPEIIIREKPIPNWQTLFTTRRRQFLKNDGSGIPLVQIDVGNSMLPVLQMAISCGAVVVTSPAAPLVLVALAAGLPSAAEILFKLFQPENKKQEDVSREIKIQHYKWYSFRKWMKKSHCIASSANARNHVIRKPFFVF